MGTGAVYADEEDRVGSLVLLLLELGWGTDQEFCSSSFILLDNGEKF